MKPIQPINLWQNGQTVTANALKLSIVSDNLIDSATFLYVLLFVDDEDNEVAITTGNESITGEEYINWGESNRINEDAYIIIANKLNLELL